MTLSTELQEYPATKITRLNNTTCPYCGIDLTPESRTEEHVIGRRFVPKGALENQWNLILWACGPCNVRKSDLEDDLSAISMRLGSYFAPEAVGDRTGRDAVRKGKSISRRTKKPVSDSNETFRINVPFGPGAEFKFNFTAPPQADSERVLALARMQLMGFFYWVTFNPNTSRGRFWRSGCYLLLEASRNDWGNEVHQAFMRSVVDWEPRVLAVTASGHFGVVIRKHPSADCWSWGLEWNRGLRAVGFFGERPPVDALVADFPRLDITKATTGPDSWMGFRLETTLKPEDDGLFQWNGPS